ncbi:MAG: hypothetical protein IKD41_04480 [Alistipes sp.]|nr:hypothetical protein [Alistipes sp.]
MDKYQDTEQQNVDTPEQDMTEVVIRVPSKLKRFMSSTKEVIQSLFTGEIIVNQTMSKGYDYLFYLALLFLVSIITLFSSLHQQIKVNQLEAEVTLLHEKAVRMQEQRIKATTHSAIVNALEQRGIELYDAIEPVTIIDKK